MTGGGKYTTAALSPNFSLTENTQRPHQSIHSRQSRPSSQPPVHPRTSGDSTIPCCPRRRKETSVLSRRKGKSHSRLAHKFSRTATNEFELNQAGTLFHEDGGFVFGDANIDTVGCEERPSTHTDWLIKQLSVSESKITVELTESLKLVDNKEYRSVLALIKESGCERALDDFDTGQSSLSYIKQVAVDIVKIDKSFVRDIATDPADAAFILAILKMAKAFNLLTVAEGVETLEQLAFLKKNGCHLAQGFLFKKAFPYEEFIEFVENFDGDQWISA